MIREPIYAAVVAKLGASAGFVTISRRFRTFGNVAPVDRPAMYLMQKTEAAKVITGLPTVWTIRCDVVIYISVGSDPASSPGTVLNPFLDAIEAALAPDPTTGKLTLGGLVQHCRIDGPIQIDESINGDISIALIPLEILVAN